MATQTDPTGKPAPAGGFQQGGWYSGYQYYNGSFAPQAGLIHPQSSQVGAGQPVSAEVNRQTSIAAGKPPNANQEYVDKLNAMPKPSGTTAESTVSAGIDQYGAATASGLDISGAGGAGLGTAGMGQTAVPDLVSLQKTLYANAGIEDLQKQLDEMTKTHTETKAKINDNPFLSEATRVGRVAKLEQLYNERTKNTIDQIATKKADIETQMNLQLKQFDLNSQAAKDALSYFNTLLEAGALDSASGSDIATITRSTGIPSSVIYSAINARKQKKRELSVDTFTADSGEVTAVTIDKNTGEVVSKVSLGNIGNAQTGGGGGGTVTERKEADYQANRSNLIGDIQRGATLRELVNYYGGVIDITEIYRLYNSYSPHGEAKESLDDVKQGRNWQDWESQQR